jgi:hypothetical protein
MILILIIEYFEMATAAYRDHAKDPNYGPLNIWLGVISKVLVDKPE